MYKSYIPIKIFIFSLLFFLTSTFSLASEKNLAPVPDEEEGEEIEEELEEEVKEEKTLARKKKNGINENKKNLDFEDNKILLELD